MSPLTFKHTPTLPQQGNHFHLSLKEIHVLDIFEYIPNYKYYIVRQKYFLEVHSSHIAEAWLGQF